jgi:hypothetical protein
VLKLKFRSYRSGRVWEVVFALGSDEENSLEAIRYAWRNNAAIVSATV